MLRINFNLFQNKEFSHGKTKSQRLHPELEDMGEKEVIDLPEHTVTVTNISVEDLTGHAGTKLGWNQVPPYSHHHLLLHCRRRRHHHHVFCSKAVPSPHAWKSFFFKFK